MGGPEGVCEGLWDPGEGWEDSEIHRMMLGGCKGFGSPQKDLGPPKGHRDLEVR